MRRLFKSYKMKKMWSKAYFLVNYLHRTENTMSRTTNLMVLRYIDASCFSTGFSVSEFRLQDLTLPSPFFVVPNIELEMKNENETVHHLCIIRFPFAFFKSIPNRGTQSKLENDILTKAL